MPVPQGDITTTQVWLTAKPEEVEPESTLEEAIKAADAQEATEEYVLEEAPKPKKKAAKKVI